RWSTKARASPRSARSSPGPRAVSSTRPATWSTASGPLAPAWGWCRTSQPAGSWWSGSWERPRPSSRGGWQGWRVRLVGPQPSTMFSAQNRAVSAGGNAMRLNCKRRGICTLSLMLAGLALAAALIAAPGGGEQTAGIVHAWLVASAAAQDAKSVPVTVDTFIRAETDTYFKKRADLGPLGQFGHLRAPTSIDQQRVIRMN